MENETKKIDELEAGLDAWDDYISGNFLKAINVNSDQEAFGVLKVEISETNGEKRPRLTLKKGDNEFEFDLNKTNSKKLKELGIKSPKTLVGKSIYFTKALVRNPQTNMEVEGLRVSKVGEAIPE